MHYLLDSANENEIEPEIIGLGLPYKGNGTKFIRMMEYLETIPDEHIILFVDAFDVAIIKRKEEILEEFLKMDSPLVVAAERQCFPFHWLKKHFPEQLSFPYINSGCYMGYAGFIKNMLKKIDPKPRESDQGMLTCYYLQNRSGIKIDHECKLFLCLHLVKDNEIVFDQEDNVLVQPTQSSPAVIHANSGSFTLLDQIFKRAVLHQ